MAFDFPVLMDFVSSLAVIALLASCYGAIRRRFAGDRLAPVMLGLLFGIVAVTQMHAPLSPVDGLIVDVRAVPVVLAGAFLGLRGMIVCVLIAGLARFEIGGVGMMSGLLGLAWDRLTRHHELRGARHLLLLGAMTTLGLAGGLILPAPMAAWFYSVAAGPLAVMYLLAVPAIGAFLERERRMLCLERRMAAGAATDDRSGLLAQGTFLREIANRRAAGADPISAIMVVTLSQRGWLTAHWGKAIFGHILGGLRYRLADLVRHGDVVAVTPGGDVLVPLTRAEVENRADLSVAIRRAVSDRAILLPDGDAARVSVSDRMIDITRTTTLDDMAQALEARPDTKRTGATRHSDPAPRSAARGRHRNSHRALFEKSAVLLEKRLN